MRFAVVCLLILSCRDHERPKPKPRVVARDAAVDPREARRAAAIKAQDDREAHLPKRTPCKADCDLEHDPRADGRDCVERAPGILVLGFMAHISCSAVDVIIDCCPPLKGDDLPGIMKALGWATANSDEQASIAWFVVRAIFMEGTLEALPDDFTTPASFTPPSQHRDADHNLVLDFWARTYLHPRYYHRGIVFHPDGTVEFQDLGTVEVLGEDPESRRKSAIDEAKRAGILK